MNRQKSASRMKHYWSTQSPMLSSASTWTQAPRQSPGRSARSSEDSSNRSGSSVAARQLQNHDTRLTTSSSLQCIRCFCIYTDQKPLTSAFFKARDPVSNRQRQQLTFISKFRTDIAHVRGIENVVADALTCQYDDVEATAIVHAIAHTLSDVSLADLVADQPPLDDEPASSLRLKHVQFPGVDSPVVCDTSMGEPRVLVTEVHRRPIFEAIHNLAHPSGRETLAIIAKTYVWPWMRSNVLRWSRQCRSCGASKVAVHTKPPVLPIPVLATRFDHVHIDIVGPFPPVRGYRHLLTMVDRTTRWPKAVPIADTTAETVLQSFLDSLVSRFGVPVTVTSDRGAQFTSEVW